MLNPAVNYVSLVNSVINCLDGVADLGNHPPLEDSIFYKLFRLDQVNRSADRSGLMEGLDAFEQQAFNLVLSRSQQAFDLTMEQRAALASGDITAIEKWVGPLEERLKVWLKARLEMERW